jgi:hypothetical protein
MAPAKGLDLLPSPLPGYTLTLCKPASLRVQAEVRALEARLADMGYSGVLCCSMYWRMMLIGAPPQDAAK